MLFLVRQFRAWLAAPRPEAAPLSNAAYVARLLVDQAFASGGIEALRALARDGAQVHSSGEHDAAEIAREVEAEVGRRLREIMSASPRTSRRPSP